MTTTFSPPPIRPASLPAGGPTRVLPALLLLGLVAAAGGAALALGLGGRETGEPLTPGSAAEAHAAAVMAGDVERSWDLLCEADQELQGPRDRYAAKLANPDVRGLRHLAVEVEVGDVRAAGPPERDGFVVELRFSIAGLLVNIDETAVVIEEDAYRVCSSS